VSSLRGTSLCWLWGRKGAWSAESHAERRVLKEYFLNVSNLEVENCLDFKQIQMGANNDETCKICFNIFVGIGTVLTQARLRRSGGENMWPLHIVSIVAAFSFLLFF